jgi:hypothetical protein
VSAGHHRRVTSGERGGRMYGGDDTGLMRGGGSCRGMVEPHGRDESMTGFLVVRLWWDEDASPALRARVRAALDVATEEVRSVPAAGRGELGAVLERLLDEFERTARRRSSGG